MTYRILSSQDIRKLENAVNEARQQGLTPVGGIDYKNGSYIQPVASTDNVDVVPYSIVSTQRVEDFSGFADTAKGSPLGTVIYVNGSFVQAFGSGSLTSALKGAERAGAISNGIQAAIDASRAGQTVLTLSGDETVLNIRNPDGVEIDARRGRVFDSTGYQLTTYSNPRSRFVNGTQYLSAFLKKMMNSDGVTTAKKTYIVWSGDSTTVGVNAEPWSPSYIANYYARRFGVKDVSNVNLGHSGKTLYEWGLWYINQEWSTFAAADLVVLRWGINDPYYGYTLEQIRTALYTGLEKLRANKTLAQQSIVIMTPSSTYDMPNGRDAKYYEQLTAILREAAEKFQCMFFDTYGMWQDSRHGAGVYLDDPYNDGRGVHPDATFNAQIYLELFHYLYGPVTVINGTTNLFSNTGSSVQMVNASWGPTTYELGESWWRANVSDATWPVNGLVKCERFVDGIVVQTLYGWQNEKNRVTYSRTGLISANTWGAWRGVPVTIASSMMANSWTASGTYHKSTDGTVTLCSTLTPGILTVDTTIMTLPDGYRPRVEMKYVVCGTNSGFATVKVSTSGIVTVTSIPVDATEMSLNITFPTPLV